MPGYTATAEERKSLIKVWENWLHRKLQALIKIKTDFYNSRTMNRYFVSLHCTVTFVLLSTFQHTMYKYILGNCFQNQRAFNSWPQWPLHCNVNVENSVDCTAGFKRKAAQCRWWPGAGTEILKTHQHSMENAANVQYFWQKMEVLYVPICAELKTCGGGSQGRNWSWRPPQSSPGTRGCHN